MLTLDQIVERNKIICNLIQAQQDVEYKLFYAEQRLHDDMETHYVLCFEDETFKGHMSNVTYENGYYEQIDEAVKAAKDELIFTNGGTYKIFNLNGREVAKGEVVL